jgi:hypothetical protein
MILVVADLWSSRFFPGHKLFAGLRIEATDANWSAGEGPVVRGPIEELILAMSGRTGGLDQLQGEGIASVRDRAAGQTSQNQNVKSQNLKRGFDHA